MRKKNIFLFSAKKEPELQLNYVCCNTISKETIFLPSDFCIEFSGISIYLFCSLCVCVSADGRKALTPGRFPPPLAEERLEKRESSGVIS